jgi:hypothetical protein
MIAMACRTLVLLPTTSAAAQNVDETPDAGRDFIVAKASLESGQGFVLLQAIPTGEKSQSQEMAQGDPAGRKRWNE